MSIQQEEFLILLSLDSLSGIILFGFEVSIVEQVKSIARSYCGKFINDHKKTHIKNTKNNFSYKSFISDLKSIENDYLIPRIESYSSNIYYKFNVFEEKISEIYFLSWQEIEKIAINLQNLSDELINSPDDDIITILCDLETDWWSGDIEKDGIYALRTSESKWDLYIDEILEIDFHLEIIARRIFAHPNNLSFLYRWARVFGIERYQNVRNYISQELNQRLLRKNKSNSYHMSDVFLFF
jgi:ABC-type antimicrobial peptide transport system permease subunit